MSWACQRLKCHSSQHNASSRLLRLPQEIRNMIFELVCGQNLAHVICGSGEKLRSYTYSLGKSMLHQVGSSSVDDFQELESRQFLPVLAFTLVWLRTCKQLYCEMKEMPYHGACFEIHEGKQLGRFLTRSGSFTAQIKCLIFHTRIHTKKDLEAWTDALYLVPGAFSNLQAVRINHSSTVQTPQSLPNVSPSEACAKQKKYNKGNPHARFWQAIAQLRNLPLKKVVLEVASWYSDVSTGNVSDEQQSWIDHFQESKSHPTCVLI